MTLFELTCRECGIVIYDNGSTIVCNWSAVCRGENELPVLTQLGTLLGWEAETEIAAEKAEKVPSWIEYIKARADELTLLYDEWDVMRTEQPDCPAMVYTLTDGTIIVAPEDWV